MTYTVNKLAKIAGVSVRTLHHYDAIGLLRPERAEKNGYRLYGETELLRLQQILFFRELDFPLDEIRRVLARPDFDMRAALKDQRTLIELKKKRLDGLIGTIDRTIKRLNRNITMDDKDLYGDFSTEEMDAYAKEAKQRWGHTDAWKQSQERTKHWTKADYARIKEDGDKFMREFVTHLDEGPTGPTVQRMIGQHYAALRTFYEPNLEMYRGLGDMYVNDPRFGAYYEKYAPGLAQFMRDAMHAFCDAGGEKK
ncbi:MAG TPA: MerR family transcriptional regulator [Candidatus Eisenbacteria bacterium]|nr:MerR family transcriptional regulator [Candidatus Eisenbacteria bacterium]